MKLLVLCPHYAPDTAPTGEVIEGRIVAREVYIRGAAVAGGAVWRRGEPQPAGGTR